MGRIALDGSRSILDRTTLPRLDEGRVRQLIEMSNEGRSWDVGFDAIYHRARR